MPCVAGLGLGESGVEGVDDDNSALLVEQELFDLLDAVVGVDGVVHDAEEEGGVFGEGFVAVNGGEDFGGGVVEAYVADGLLLVSESGEGFSVDDGVGEGDGEGGFSGLGESGEEDKGVGDEEVFVAVGAGVAVEVRGFDLLEG